MLIDCDQFLSELSKLFQQQRLKSSGSLCLTMKRYDGRTKPKSKPTKKQRLEEKSGAGRLPNSLSTTSNENIEYKCLVRANFGSKKLSTVVSAKDMNRFQLGYANLLKLNMDTLKKKAKEAKGASQTASQNVRPNPSSPTVVPQSPKTGSSSMKKTTNPVGSSPSSTPTKKSSSSKKK